MATLLEHQATVGPIVEVRKEVLVAVEPRVVLNVAMVTAHLRGPVEVAQCGVDKPLTHPMRRAIADYLTRHTTVQAVRFVRRKGTRSIEYQIQRNAAGAADV